MSSNSFRYSLDRISIDIHCARWQIYDNFRAKIYAKSCHFYSRKTFRKNYSSLDSFVSPHFLFKKFTSLQLLSFYIYFNYPKMLILGNNKYILTFLYNTPLHELIERSIPGYLTLARVARIIAVIFANGCNRPVKLRYIRAGLETSRGENPQLISAPSPRYLLSRHPPLRGGHHFDHVM